MRTSLVAQRLHQREGSSPGGSTACSTAWLHHFGRQTTLGPHQMPDQVQQKTEGLDGLRPALQIAAVTETQPGRPKLLIDGTLPLQDAATLRHAMSDSCIARVCMGSCRVGSGMQQSVAAVVT